MFLNYQYSSYASGHVKIFFHADRTHAVDKLVLLIRQNSRSGLFMNARKLTNLTASAENKLVCALQLRKQTLQKNIGFSSF